MLLKHPRSRPREGGQQGGTPISLTSTGHRAGTVEGQAGCTVCVRRLGRAVSSSSPPASSHQRRAADFELLPAQEESSRRRRWGDMARIRARPGRSHCRSSRSHSPRSLSGDAFQTGLHRKGRRPDNDRWGSRLWKTRSSSTPFARSLQCIYEEDFVGFSYGFRPHRAPHQALDALYVAITEKRVNWILDADIEGFFDNIDRDWLVKFIEHRVGDKRIIRLIQKWLHAGIIEGTDWSDNGKGTPQGAVLSPLLANVFLHYVFRSVDQSVAKTSCER